MADDEILERSFVTLSVEHGIDPVGDQYAYVLLPGVSAADVQEFVSRPPIEILATTSDVQAVAAGSTHAVNVFTRGTFGIGGREYAGPISAIRIQSEQAERVAAFDPTRRDHLASRPTHNEQLIRSPGNIAT